MTTDKRSKETPLDIKSNPEKALCEGLQFLLDDMRSWEKFSIRALLDGTAHNEQKVNFSEFLESYQSEILERPDQHLTYCIDAVPSDAAMTSANLENSLNQNLFVEKLRPLLKNPNGICVRNNCIYLYSGDNEVLCFSVDIVTNTDAAAEFQQFYVRRPSLNSEIDAIWEKIRERVHGLVTERINMFYDALMERNQIPSTPPAAHPKEQK